MKITHSILTTLFLTSTCITSAAFAQSAVDWAGTLDSRPCAPRKAVSNDFDMKNSDDLFYVGKSLNRGGRVAEAIECLNRGKHIAPDYLDIRLELMNAFAQFNDQKSGFMEAIEFNLTKAVDTLSPESAKYYHETFDAYFGKLTRIQKVAVPQEGFKFEPVPQNFEHSVYKSLQGEAIVDEAKLKLAIEMKFQGQFVQARQTINPLLFSNPKSPTVWFWAGLMDYTLAHPDLAVKELDTAIALADHDLDVTLGMARAMNANGMQVQAYALLKREENRFTKYGCTQLAHAALDAAYKVNATKAKEIEGIILRGISSGQEAQICIELKL